MSEVKQLNGQEKIDKFSNIDKTEQLMRYNNRIFRVKNSDHTFKIFTLNGSGVLAENRGYWHESEFPVNFKHMVRSDTIFTNPVPALVRSQMFTCIVKADKVPLGEYNLYLRHHLNHSHTMMERLELTVTLHILESRPDSGSVEVSTKQLHYLDNYIDRISASKIYRNEEFTNSYICKIDTTDTQLTPEQWCNITVKWSSLDNNWKRGYTIDGILLMNKNDDPIITLK